MKDLYLMRHGQTFFNQEGLVQGACDSPLTELGQDQARQAGAEPVLAVSHGGAMWAFYLKIAAQALDPKVRFGNCAICHYHYEQGHFKLAEVIDPLTGDVYECETSL